MWLSSAVALLVLVTLLLGAFVGARSKDRVNTSFALLAYAIALWISANYIGSNFKTHYFARYFVHADFLLGAATALCFWYFTSLLLAQTDAAKKVVAANKHLRPLYVALTCVVMLVTLFPITVSVANHPTASLYDIAYGKGYIFYVIALVALLLSGLVNIAFLLRYAKAMFHQQAVTISRGLIVAVLLIAAANLLLPQLTASASINLIAGNLSYLGIVAFVGGTAYAIIRHKLFDLRFFVVRAVTYALSTALLALFCLLPGTWIVSRILHVHFSALTFVSLALLSFFLTLVYQNLKKLFDKITLRIFYRQYYDPQDVLDKLSDLLVRSIDLGWLQSKSGEVIATTLGVKMVEYWLTQDSHTSEIADLRRLFGSAKEGVIVLDEIVDHKELVGRLRRQDIAAAVLLRTTHGELGYIVLGFKESGGAYTQQDKRLLSTAADEIAISMQNALHFEEIQNFNKTLQAKVQQATKELRRTNDKLKALDETKDEFITMASHQLRTPLTSVKGYLSMVLEGDAGKLNANQHKLLEQSFISSQRMVYLISDLLNLSRLNTGKFVIESSPVDLSEVVQSEIDQLAETAKSRDLDLVYKKPTAFPQLMLDETKIHQVVMNLIDNAIYYTPSGGTVTVELRETPTAVEYMVHDTGIGVPKAVQHKLFTKFYRAQNAQQARPDGTGLGLFMVKKVVAAQGGSIIFQSEEGKGSTFGFRFSKAHRVAEPTNLPLEKALQKTQ